jgi:hypothetical protein
MAFPCPSTIEDDVQKTELVGTDRSVPTLVYSTTSMMTPEPTVMPPSRMAKWLPEEALSINRSPRP